MIRRLVVSIFALVLSFFALVTTSGCSVVDDAFQNAIYVGILEEQVDSLLEENVALKKELANLKFDIYYPNGVVGEDSVVELNLVDRSVVGDGDALTVVDNAQVTINDGYFDGGNTSFGGSGNTAVWCNGENAKVVINGGHFYIGGLATNDEGTKDVGHIDLIYCSQGTIEINGGLFEGADDTVWLLNCRDAQYKDGTAKIIVKGGTFVNWNPADCVSEGEHTSFLADGYVVVTIEVDGKTYYKVVEDTIVQEDETTNSIVEDSIVQEQL